MIKSLQAIILKLFNDFGKEFKIMEEFEEELEKVFENNGQRATVDKKIKNNKKKQEFLKIFSENLKRAREAKGLTKIQFGDMCGLLPSNYHRYESGSQEPGVITALLMSSILNVSINELFSSETNQRVLEGLRCQAWFEAHGISTSYDNENIITLYSDDFPTKTITVDNAKTVIKETKDLITPVLRDIVMAEIIKAKFKKPKKSPKKKTVNRQ